MKDTSCKCQAPQKRLDTSDDSILYKKKGKHTNQQSSHQEKERQSKMNIKAQELKNLQPSFKVCQPFLRSRKIPNLQSGYLKYTGCPYPPSNFIELTQIELNFLQQKSSQFFFYDFNLMTKEVLQKSFICLSKQQDQTNECQLKQILENQLFEEQEISSSIFQLLKQENVEMFNKFIDTIVTMWIKRNQINNNYRLNNPIIPQDFKPYTLKYKPNKPSVMSASAFNMRSYLHFFVKQSSKIQLSYEQLKSDHQHRKSEYLSHIFDLLRNIKIFSQCSSFQKISSPNQKASLHSIDYSIQQLLQQISTRRPMIVGLNQKKKKKHSFKKIEKNEQN